MNTWDVIENKKVAVPFGEFRKCTSCNTLHLKGRLSKQKWTWKTIHLGSFEIHSLHSYIISNLFDNMHIWKSNNQRFWRCTNNYCQISRYFWKKIMFIFFAEFFLKIKCDTEYLNSKAWASEEGRKKAAISHFFRWWKGEKCRQTEARHFCHYMLQLHSYT